MKIKLVDAPINIMDGIDKSPKVFASVALVAFGLGLSSAFYQSPKGIIAMAIVLAIELVTAWYLGKPK
jgi:hypothetical protein